MALQKPPDFTKYKFRALKTYTSTEWLADSQKKYRQVFDRGEVSYIYAEFTFFNKLFDEEDWEAQIELIAYERGESEEPKRKICKLETAKHVSKDLNIVPIREGWGSDDPGATWREGEYYWEAYIDGEKVGTQPFYVYDVGKVTPTDNPYISIKGVKLYEGANKDGRKRKRTYYTEFRDKDTRFVWIEFKAENKLDRDWMCELTFNFYNDARQLKGRTIELHRIKKNQKTFTITSGWGSDHKGTWFADNYTVEIVFMDTLIGVIPFKVGDEFIEGETQLLTPDATGTMLGIPTTQELDKQSLEEVLAEMDELIGLESIKARLREYSQYLKFLNLRKEKGFEDEKPVNLHVVFTGNPGTGKTTVARMLGKIYRKLGLLSRGHVHEVDRSDIIGEYIGQTAPKVKAAIDKARGGILFIDEAYSLARSNDDAKDYGREVIEMLVKEMSSGKGDLAIVVAGYPKEMDTFLHSNPGLKSRFTMRFDFPDYTPQELEEIAMLGAKRRSVEFAPEARTYLSKKLVDAYRSRSRTFGNARYVLSLVDEAKMNLGLRIMRSQELDSLTKEELSTITEADVAEIFEGTQRKKADIPIDEALLTSSLEELNSLIGLEKVKTEVNELVKLVKFYREIGKDVLSRFSLHTVFTGNPGTGKTTVARIIGKIYKALGILERGHMLECDRQALVAGFLGQTAIKTAEVIEKAKGGVLFVDEAYSLSQGGPNDFGREAVETLLKRMEDLRGDLVVIAAGYPKNMQEFLEINPGLKSRFDRKLEFPDYKP
ncbi:MAG: AAA family ATPase, partial [Bacteroidetes bacterium]